MDSLKFAKWLERLTIDQPHGVHFVLGGDAGLDDAIKQHAQKLLSLWEATQWSASTANQQPWYFIVATKKHEAEHACLLSCLRENNQQWASRAPVLIRPSSLPAWKNRMPCAIRLLISAGLPAG